MKNRGRKFNRKPKKIQQKCKENARKSMEIESKYNKNSLEIH